MGNAKILSFSASIITSISLLCSSVAVAAPQEQLIDVVIASVNNHPITLREVCSQLKPPRDLSLSQASSDPEVRFVLDSIITEHLITEEGKARRLAVSDKEIEAYLEEVAKRNNMSPDQFSQALSKEHMTVEQYKQRIGTEILKSRLTATLARDGVGVSDEEIDSYIKDNPTLKSAGAKLKLSQILISSSAADDSSEDSTATKVKEIEEKLKSGDDFEDLAESYSDAPEAAQGGSLGVLSVDDLSHDILDAVLLLKEGEVSAPITLADGVHFFRVDERFDSEEKASKELREEVRKTIEKQKLETKLISFFTVDLFKKYTVDKKI